MLNAPKIGSTTYGVPGTRVPLGDLRAGDDGTEEISARGEFEGFEAAAECIEEDEASRVDLGGLYQYLPLQYKLQYTTYSKI